MKNQTYTGTPTSRRFALCPSTVHAGDPVLLGAEPAVALDDYSSVTGGTTFLTGGSFNLTVIGQTVASPQTAAAIKPGAKVYATGSLDSTTNVTTGLTLDGVTTATPFGFIDPSYTSGVTSGATDTAAIVRLQGAE
jgi:predicted RecA/RadA family phage recombinase